MITFRMWLISGLLIGGLWGCAPDVSDPGTTANPHTLETGVPANPGHGFGPPGRALATSRVSKPAVNVHLHPERSVDAYVADPPGPKSSVQKPDLVASGPVQKGTLPAFYPAINIDDTQVDNGALLTPADPSGAAGPNHLVNVVNSSLEILDKSTGTMLEGYSLADFFISLAPSGRPFDPRVIFDQIENRFVVVAADKQDDGVSTNASQLLVAVSIADDPTLGWYFASVDTLVNDGLADHWLDFPGLAVDKDAIYVTGNVFRFQDDMSFPGLLGGTRLVVIDKGDLYAGISPISVAPPYDPAASAGCFSNVTHQPAHMFGTVAGNLNTYLVGFDGITSGSQQLMQLIRVESALTTPVFSCDLVFVGNIDGDVNSTIPDAPQAGLSTDTSTNMTIETNNRRILNAVYRSDLLYVVTTVNPPVGNADNGQATVFWAEFDTSVSMSPDISRSGFVGGEDIAFSTHTFYPSVSVNSDGGLVIGFNASAATISPGAYLTLRSPGDPDGSNRGSVLLAAGLDYFQRTLNLGRNRWGDYSATSVYQETGIDCFWVYSQYSLVRGNQTPDPTDLVDGLLDDDDGRWGTVYDRYCNEAPTANTENISVDLAVTNSATTLVGGGSSLLTNDTDPDMNIVPANIDALSLSVTPAVDVLHGSITLNPNGSFIYVNDGTPNLNMGLPIILPDGTPDMDDSFDYTVCDDGSPVQCGVTTVQIAVQSENHVPGAIDDAFAVDEGTTYDVGSPGFVNLLDNDLTGVNLAGMPMLDPGQILTVNTTPVVTPMFASAFTLFSDGAFSYTHDDTENFSDSFTYEICDDGLPVLCDQAVVTVTINPVNETPVAVDDALGMVVNLVEGGTATMLDSGETSLTFNDSDQDLGDNLFVEANPVTGPSFGAVTLAAGGTFSYMHDGTENFSDSFVYRVCDRSNMADPERLCAEATVTITITPVNDAPNSGADMLTINEGDTGASTLDSGETLLLNLVSDDENDTVTITADAGQVTGGGGTVTIAGGNGSFVYDHDGSESTSDSFIYEACDDGVPVECSTGTITVNINPIDDLPVASPDFISVMESGVAVTLNSGDDSVLDNDLDVDSNLNAVLIIPPSFNSLAQPFEFNIDGTFQYTHDGSENFSDSFSYQACEATGGLRCTGDILVTITINSVNEPPAPVADGFLVAEGGTFDALVEGFNLLTNDSDPDMDPLTVEMVPAVAPLFASAFSLNGDGTFVYTHNGSETVNDSFTYTVCDRPMGDPDRLCADAIVNITISMVNDPPAAADDDLDGPTAPIVLIAEDSGLTVIDSMINLLVNDVTGGGETQTLTVIGVSNPIGGTVGLSGGDVEFTTAGDFNGAASFTYTMQDDDSAGPPTFQTDTANVSFTITEVNDAPVSMDDIVADAPEDLTTIIDPAVDMIPNDSPGPANESGQTLAVTSVSNPLPAGSTVIINGNMIEFTPLMGHNGLASFDYVVTDDGTTNGGNDFRDSNTSTVSFTVTPANDPPVANDDTTADVVEDTPLVQLLIGTPGVSGLLINDSATPGETEVISISMVDDFVGGTAVINGGNIDFTPSTDFNGAASFRYTLTDDAGGGAGGPMTDTAVVSFTITEVNDPPVAMDDNLPAIPEDMPALIVIDPDITGNDTPGPTNESGQNLSFLSVSNPLPAGSTVTIMGPNVEFTPMMNYSGPASFEYTIEDDGTTNGGADPQSATGLVSFLVDGFPDPPTGFDDSLTAVSDTAATVLDGGATSVLDNDTDPDSILEVSQVIGTTTEPTGTPVTTAAGATVTVQSDGTFSYLYSGAAPVADSFDYQLCDDTQPVAQCTTATVNVSVLDAGNIAACAPGGRRVVVGVPVAIQTASEFTGGGLSYGATGLPPTLSIDSGTGIITGIPDITDFGNSPFAVEVTATGGAMPQTIQFLVVVDNDFDVVYYSGVEDSCIGL